MCLEALMNLINIIVLDSFILSWHNFNNIAYFASKYIKKKKKLKPEMVLNNSWKLSSTNYRMDISVDKSLFSLFG